MHHISSVDFCIEFEEKLAGLFECFCCEIHSKGWNLGGEFWIRVRKFGYSGFD